MYNKSFQFLGLIIFIFTCFFALIISFNTNSIKNVYRAAKDQSMELDKNESKSTNTRFLGHPYLGEDENKINNIKIYNNKNRGVLVKNYGNDKNTNNVNKNYKNVYKVIVNIGGETLNIYDNNQLIKIMASYIGTHILPIVIVAFVTINKRSHFFNDKLVYEEYYWTNSKRGYFFNSTSYDKNKNMIKNETFKESNKVSYKNSRFFLDDIKCRNNISKNSKVCFKT